MRAVMLQMPEALIAERRRTGADLRDEMWEGVLHMGPPPSERHQRLGAELFVVLAPLAKAHGLVPYYETGLFRPGVDDDYRVPDQVYARAEQASGRGVEGPAPLVVEIRSPHDETDDKLRWYAGLGVGQVLVLQPDTRQVEVHGLAGAGGGRLDCLDLDVATVDGPRLRLTWPGGSAEI